MKITQLKNHQKPLLELQFQRGLSLVELLIAMVIGMFLMGGLVTNFIGTKKSDKVRAVTSEMDASAQTALNVLRQAITHAAYPSINNIELEKAFVTTDDFPTGSTGSQAMSNPNCSDGKARDISPPEFENRTRDNGKSDRLMIVSLADNPSDSDSLVYYDCTGGGMTMNAHDIACSVDNMPNKKDAKIFSNFRINNRGRPAVPTLFCDGSRGGGQPIADNVYAIQYLYGVTRNPQDPAIARTIYKNADAVELADEWRLVNSVQIALLMRSEEQYVLDQDGKASYKLLDSTIPISSDQRRRLYRIYSTTVNLENMNKAPLL